MLHRTAEPDITTPGTAEPHTAEPDNTTLADVAAHDLRKQDTAAHGTAAPRTATVATASHPNVMLDTATLDTATLDTATLDTATLDTATLDTATLDTATLDITTFDMARRSTAGLDNATLDTAAPEAAQPDTPTTFDAAGVQSERRELTRASVSSYIPRSSRRTVVERDGLGCSWVDEQGVRCGSSSWLEYDHRIPRAKGGGSEPDNLRLLCRSHNRFAAEREYGRAHVEHTIAERRRARAPHAI